MSTHTDELVTVVSDDGAHIDIALVHHESAAPTTNLEFVDAETSFSGLILGVQAIIGTFWWFITMFVYVKNTPSD